MGIVNRKDIPEELWGKRDLNNMQVQEIEKISDQEYLVL